MEKLIFTKHVSGEPIDENERIEIYNRMKESGISEDMIEYYFSLDMQGVINHTLFTAFQSGVLRLVCRLFEVQNHTYGEELCTMLGDLQDDVYVSDGKVYFDADYLTYCGLFKNEDFAKVYNDPVLNSIQGVIYENGILYLSLRALEKTINSMFFTKKVEVKTSTYLVTDASGYVKIGRSTNVGKRFNSILQVNPSLKMIATVERDVENELHKKYRHERVLGEWFKLTNEQVKEIIADYEFQNKNKNYER